AEQAAAALAEARRRRAAGDTAGALAALQALLALEPAHGEARALETELLRERDQAAEEAALRAVVAEQLEAAEEAFGRGDVARSLALVNRLLALDPGNAAARELARGAYRRLNRELLGGGEAENLPPAISFLDGRLEEPDGELVERVKAPQFQLGGLVLDES